MKDDRINLDYIKDKDWSLGIAYDYLRLASVATAFMKVGAQRMLLSRADQLDRAVSLGLAMP